MFDALQGYEPQPVKDGFDPIKGTFNCEVEYARIEDYDGDKPELQGAKFEKWSLTVYDDMQYAGRKLFKSWNLGDPDKLRKLADFMFTLGLEFKSEEELAACNEKLANEIKFLKVRAWSWSPEKGADPIQMFAVKGKVDETEPAGAPAF